MYLYKHLLDNNKQLPNVSNREALQSFVTQIIRVYFKIPIVKIPTPQKWQSS